jgi:hypothetical protein
VAVVKQLKIPESFGKSTKKFIDEVNRALDNAQKVQKAAQNNVIKFPQLSTGPIGKMQQFDRNLLALETRLLRGVHHLSRELGPGGRSVLTRITSMLPDDMRRWDVNPLIKAVGLGGMRLLPFMGPMTVVSISKWLFDKSVEIMDAINNDNMRALSMRTTIGGLRAFRVGTQVLDTNQLQQSVFQAVGNITGRESRVLSLVGANTVNTVGMDTTTKLLTTMIVLQKWVQRQKKGTELTAAHMIGLDQTVSPTLLMQLRTMSPEELQEIVKWVMANRAGMEVDPEVADNVRSLTKTFKNLGVLLESEFLNRLADAAQALTPFLEKLTKWITPKEDPNEKNKLKISEHDAESAKYIDATSKAISSLHDLTNAAVMLKNQHTGRRGFERRMGIARPSVVPQGRGPMPTAPTKPMAPGGPTAEPQPQPKATDSYGLPRGTFKDPAPEWRNKPPPATAHPGRRGFGRAIGQRPTSRPIQPRTAGQPAPPQPTSKPSAVQPTPATPVTPPEGAPKPAQPPTRQPAAPMAPQDTGQPVPGLPTDAGGYNYFQKHGHNYPFQRNELTTIQTPYGPATVHPDAAADFQGFYNDLHKAGAPLNKLGSYNPRRQRWSRKWSSHAMGAATDMDDATELSPAMKKWIQQHPDEWTAIQRKWNIGQPLPDKDPPHMEWRGPHGSHFDNKGQPVPGQGSGPPVATGPQGTAGKAPRGTIDQLPQGQKVDSGALYKRYVQEFRNSSLNGYVPKDGARFGIKKGTPEEWARLAVATSKQESGLDNYKVGDGGKSEGLNQFGKQDLKNYGVAGDTTDPNAQVNALVKQWSTHITKDGVIAENNKGAARYFGSLRDRGDDRRDVDQYINEGGWADKVQQRVGEVPRTAQEGPVDSTASIRRGMPGFGKPVVVHGNEPPPATPTAQSPSYPPGAIPGQKDRPFHYTGDVTMPGGEQYTYGTGGHPGRGSMPYGDYPLHMRSDSGGDAIMGPFGQTHSIATIGGREGTMEDPKYPGHPRGDIQIHAGFSERLDQLQSAGCFAVRPSDWPKFKRNLMTEAAKGELRLHIDQNGHAQIYHPNGAPIPHEYITNYDQANRMTTEQKKLFDQPASAQFGPEHRSPHDMDPEKGPATMTGYGKPLPGSEADTHPIDNLQIKNNADGDIKQENKGPSANRMMLERSVISKRSMDTIADEYSNKRIQSDTTMKGIIANRIRMREEVVSKWKESENVQVIDHASRQRLNMQDRILPSGGMSHMPARMSREAYQKLHERSIRQLDPQTVKDYGEITKDPEGWNKRNRESAMGRALGFGDIESRAESIKRETTAEMSTKETQRKLGLRSYAPEDVFKPQEHTHLFSHGAAGFVEQPKKTEEPKKAKSEDSETVSSNVTETSPM